MESRSNAPSRVVAAHVLRAMYLIAEEGGRASLDDLAERVAVRRVDVRQILSQLHREELVDVTRMRLTLRGLAAARAFATSELKSVWADDRAMRRAKCA